MSLFLTYKYAAFLQPTYQTSFLSNIHTKTEPEALKQWHCIAISWNKYQLSFLKWNWTGWTLLHGYRLRSACTVFQYRKPLVFSPIWLAKSHHNISASCVFARLSTSYQLNPRHHCCGHELMSIYLGFWECALLCCSPTNAVQVSQFSS